MSKSRLYLTAFALAAMIGAGGCFVPVPYGHGGRYYGPHHHHRNHYGYYGYGR